MHDSVHANVGAGPPSSSRRHDFLGVLRSQRGLVAYMQNRVVTAEKTAWNNVGHMARARRGNAVGSSWPRSTSRLARVTDTSVRMPTDEICTFEVWTPAVPRRGSRTRPRAVLELCLRCTGTFLGRVPEARLDAGSLIEMSGGSNEEVLIRAPCHNMLVRHEHRGTSAIQNPQIDCILKASHPTNIAVYARPDRTTTSSHRTGSVLSFAEVRLPRLRAHDSSVPDATSTSTSLHPRQPIAPATRAPSAEQRCREPSPDVVHAIHQAIDACSDTARTDRAPHTPRRTHTRTHARRTRGPTSTYSTLHRRRWTGPADPL
ncbi:hypothetical protein C8Q70DRAFT_40865 [Cubamyces menziesii]|nr:hypothetical protein C8Q70DRAFT_40865 [Cubamyces menziesii]